MTGVFARLQSRQPIQAANNTKQRNAMLIYGWKDGKCRGISNSEERARTQRPDLDWVCAEVHDQRQGLIDNKNETALDALHELERTMNEFFDYTETITND